VPMKVKKFVDLSQPFGHNTPLWPYFPDIKIERFHYHAKSGVFTQWLWHPMHISTHADSPIHVIAGDWSTEHRCHRRRRPQRPVRDDHRRGPREGDAQDREG
jgi:hypothetical protein